MVRPAYKISSFITQEHIGWLAKIATAVTATYRGKYEVNKRNLTYKLHLFSVEIFSFFFYEENTVLIISVKPECLW